MNKFLSLLVVYCLASLSVLGVGANDVSITRQNDLLFFVDNNSSCAPNNVGMHAAYIAYKICNITNPPVTLTNLQVNLGGFTNSQFGLAGGQTATQFIGSLAPGECDVLYWFVFYPCVYNPVQSTSLTVTVSNPPASGTKTLTETYSTVKAISALAGGDITSATVSGGTTIGSIVTLAVTYQFGQANVGDAYWLQPAGNVSPYYANPFNAGCFQLLNSKVTASTVTGIPVGSQDQLYFTETTPHGGGQTYNVTIEYYFEAHCATSTVAVPYAVQKSGTQNKYTGNYGQTIATLPLPSTNGVTISKSVTPATVVPGNLATYTVTIANSTSSKIIIDTIVDQLPAPLTFNATDNTGYVKTTNSNTYPSLGQTGTLRWIGGDLIPGDFPYTYYTVPANGSITLIYTARVPLGTSSGTYINAAYFVIGQYKSQVVQAPVKVGGDLSITKTDGKTYYGTGLNTYTIVVSNAGPGSITGASVTDYKPAMATSMTWQVTGTTGGATVDGTQSGSGDLIKTVNMPAGATITFSVTLDIPCGATGTLTNTATVAPPANVPDPNTNNNTATDSDYETVWTGDVSSDWNTAGNWTQGVPDCSKNAIIPNVSPKPFPVISTTGNFTDNLVIQQGALLTINPGKELKACGCTQINQPDGLYLKSDATGNAKFIDNGTISYSNNGSAKVELYLTSCVGFTDKFRCWHYITPPVYNATAGVFAGDYMKSYIETSGAWSPYYTHLGTLLNELQGYAVSANGSGVRTFHGQLITGTQVTDPLTRTVNLGWGWNLVGNPYASPVDLNSANITWTNVDAQAYYLDQAAGNYKVWPASNPYGYGTGTQYPLSMQGFFVHVKEGQTSGTISWTNAARTFTSDHVFYKNYTDNLLRIKVEENSGMNDEVIICFNPESSPNWDDNLDCSKIDGDPEAPQVWTLSADDDRLTVNTLPCGGKQTTVPLHFSVEQPTEGSNYILTASNLESFLAGTTITLEDKKLQATQDLGANPVYQFTYNTGDDPARFLLHFFNPFFGILDQEMENDILIYSYGNDVYLKDLTGHPEKGDLFLYNLMGQEITRKNVSDISLNKYNFNLPEGYYLVRVITKDRSYNGKVYLY